MKIALNPLSDATKTSVYLPGQIQSIRIPNLQRSVCNCTLYIKPHHFVSKCEVKCKWKNLLAALAKDNQRCLYPCKNILKYSTHFSEILEKISKTMLQEADMLAKENQRCLQTKEFKNIFDKCLKIFGGKKVGSFGKSGFFLARWLYV